MARRSDLRASDSEREQVAERLRNATAEGRLTAHELEQRLGKALSAVTHGELNATVADLPGTRVGRTAGRSQRAFSVVRAHPILLAVAIPIALVVVAVLVAIAVVWSVLLFAAALLFGRRGVRMGCAPRRVVRMSGSRRRAVGGPAPWI